MPTIDPVVPPAPICSVPALIVVPPVYALAPQRQRPGAQLCERTGPLMTPPKVTLSERSNASALLSVNCRRSIWSCRHCNVSTTYAGLYGGLSGGALQLRGGGFYGYNHYGTSRTAAFPGFADALGSGYGGDTWQAFSEAGWRMPFGGLAAYSAWAEPFAGLTGLEIAPRSFGKSAGAAALNGASATYDYGITTLGLRGEASLFAWAPLVANGMIGWQHVFGDVTPNSVLAFASAPYVPFAIAGAPIARNALALEAGIDWRFTANVKLGVYYSGLIASNASDNAIKVKLEANF